MQRFLIQCVNGLLLIIILIGIPAATRAQIGSWQISSAPMAQTLTLWSLAIVAGVNAMAALILLKGRAERKLCWKWTSVFGVLLLVEFEFFHGRFNFDWLKKTLQWFKKRF